MAALGDVYQLTAQGTYLGQRMENVYFYRIEDAPSGGAAEGLVTDFISDVMPSIQNLQSTAVVWSTIKAVNIFDASELHEEGVTLGGLVSCGGAGAETPSFTAIYFSFLRDNARVDNGSKYIGGICEGNVQQNSIVGLDAALATAETQMQAELNPGSIDAFKPVIVKRVRSVANKTNSFGQTVSYYRYRLPDTQAEMSTNWAYVRQVQASLDVSHMISRQKGRGV